MKILISPDKFKGSLSGQQVCEAIAKGIKRFDPAIETVLHPLADGGEGTLDILSSSMDLKDISIEVNDPLFRPVKAVYKMGGNKAYIEMAAASGLPLLTQEERDCLQTTTYGTGEMILDAIEKGAEHVYLFVGGSATNDAGIGMAAALGYQFLDANGLELKPVGEELVNLDRIERGDLKFNPDRVGFSVVCDVKNPLYGPEGAAYMYGAQKGADGQAIALLDKGLRQFAKVVEAGFGTDLSGLEGAGAAGGIGAGAVVFLNAKIEPGIQTIQEITSYKDKLKAVDLIITGEGKLDLQTVHGKVVHGVDQVSSLYQIPYAVMCGVAEDLPHVQQVLNAWKIVQIKTPEISLESAINEAGMHVERLAFDLVSEYSKH